MQPIDILVRAAFLYPVTDGMPVIADAEIAIAGDRILHAGPAKPAGSWAPRRILGGPTTAALPGFVNAHCHTASIVFRSQTDEHAAKSALLDVAFRMEKDIAEEEWALLAEVGCADMLRAGITTLNDIWYSPWALADCVARGGLRAQIANKLFDVRLEHLRDGDWTHHPEIGERRLRDGIDFARRWHGQAEGRITARIGPHATDTVAPALWQQAAAEARRLGIGLHTHAAQSAAEVEQIERAHGCGALEHLDRLGVLGPELVLAHLTFATDADLVAVARSGAAYAHCPTIYPRRGRYPRLEAIESRGIPTGFATDWMLNDPFEGMRNAIQAMRLRLGTPEAMSSERALWLHTMGAARVLGLEREIGSLEPGKKADLILLELDRPHLQPFYGAHSALVFYARASDVATSIIDGRVVMEGGRITGLDEAAALKALAGRLPEWKRQLAALGSRAVAGLCCG